MADKAGQIDIRGLDIDKLVKGYADVEFIFKQYLANSSTSAREMRWFQKTAGVLDSTDTTGMTSSRIYNVAELTTPEVAGPSFTRNTSYSKKYFVESEWLSEEDIKDTDIDILSQTIRDLVRAVSNQVDVRIFNVLTESQSPSNINSQNVTGGALWTGGSANPILDLLSGSKAIQLNNYDISNLVVLMHPTEYMSLLNYIITTKGSSIPQLASATAGSGVLMTIVGQRIVVSPNVTQGYVVQFVPQRAATWKSFTPITSAIKVEEGIGRKIRVWEEGEALLTDPKAVTLTSGA